MGHQVRAFRGGSSVTSIEVANDRVYTAGGNIGTIKIWQPIFANERRQVVLKSSLMLLLLLL